MIFWYLANRVFIPNENGTLSPLGEMAEPLQELTAAAPPDIGIAFVKMLLTFIAIIALLWGTYWFLRRLIQQRLQKGTGEQTIQILERRALSPTTMLYLVEVDHKKILLAESQLEVRAIYRNEFKNWEFDKESP